MNCRYVARPFAMIGARSSRYIFCHFFRRISELASSLAAESKFANFQSPTQSSHPHPGPQHFRTASHRHRDYEPYRVAYRGASSRVERSSHVPPTHPRNDCRPLRWPSSFIPRVLCTSTRKKVNYCWTAVTTAVLLYKAQQIWCNSPRVLGTHWVHTLGHLEWTNLPAGVAARYLVLWRRGFWSFVQKLEKGGVMRAVQIRCCCSMFRPKICQSER